MRTGTIVSVTLCVLTFLPGFGQDARPGPAGELRGGFENPPAAARPRVWWHWMNGNITKEGIRLDLEWMKRVGIGGLQNFDAALMTPKVVENRLAYMTSEWKETFRYAAGLADQFDLEMAIASSPGWSETGGPWVKPEQAMKKLVWSELRIRGGSPFAGTLPKPPTTTGPFQGVPLRNELPSLGGPTAPPPQYYADAAVVAYRLPPAAAPARPPATLTSSAGARDAARLSDGDLVEGVKIPLGPDGGWVQHTYPVPQTIHAVTLARPAAGLFMPTAPLVFRSLRFPARSGQRLDRVHRPPGPGVCRAFRGPDGSSPARGGPGSSDLPLRQALHLRWRHGDAGSPRHRCR